MLIHIQLLVSSCALTKKTSYSFLTSWHKSIFGYKLRTIEAEILKKLRIVSFNSEFTGSYKKV